MVRFSGHGSSLNDNVMARSPITNVLIKSGRLNAIISNLNVPGIGGTSAKKLLSPIPFVSDTVYYSEAILYDINARVVDSGIFKTKSTFCGWNF